MAYLWRLAVEMKKRGHNRVESMDDLYVGSPAVGRHRFASTDHLVSLDNSHSRTFTLHSEQHVQRAVASTNWDKKLQVLNKTD